MTLSLKTMFTRRGIAMAVFGIFAVAATACQGVGITEARQAVDNQRAINDLEEQELLPIRNQLDDLYEREILPLERELEDLWNRVHEYENGEFKDAYSHFDDPWVPGGAAHLLQEEFNAKYAEIDRRWRELDAEARRMQIEQQYSDPHGGHGIDPVIAALEDERFQMQRQLDRLHQFGRRPIEDIYLQMNELNASNGWNEHDIVQADELNRRITDIQNQIATAYAVGSHVNDDIQHELNSIESELAYLWNEGRWPIDELYQRIWAIEAEIASAAGTFTTTDAAGNSVGNVSDQIVALEAEKVAATQGLRDQIADLWAQIDAVKADAQSQIDALHAEAGTVTVEPVDTSDLQSQIDALNAQIADGHAAEATVVDSLAGQIIDLNEQIGQIYHDTDVLVADLQTQIAGVQLQIDALDSTASDYADQLAALEAQKDSLQSQVDAAIADEPTQVDSLQNQVDALEAQKADQYAATDAAVANLQSQIDALQAEIDNAVNSAGTSATTLSQEAIDQIAAIEADRDAMVGGLVEQIDGLEAQIADIESNYMDQIAALQGSAVTTTGGDVSALESELYALKDELARLENEMNEKTRVLEERRDKLIASLNGAGSANVDIAALENELVRLHDELNALQNHGFDASLNYNLRMEELQNEALRLEKQMQADIRVLEDQLWEIDGRIAELYRTGGTTNFDPWAEFNERMKQIDLERFELEQQRWALDDEQQTAFDQFNNWGWEHQAEVDARREEVLGPLHERINEIENLLRELRLKQRDLEDELRAAERRVEEQIRELEDQTLDLIEDAVTSAEEAQEVGELPNGTLDGLDPSLLDELGATDPTGATTP